ncbi:hypothetical protein LINGRAHAP2_LOCUS26016 [Linum grandiflorum]
MESTDIASLSRLQLLESLTLTRCCLDFGDAALNAFAISRLESLKLEHCYSSDNVVIVTGSKLLNLEIVLPLFDVLEIDAPKLQSFSLKTGFKMGSSYYDTLPEVSKSNLPSLSRANIELMEHRHLFLPDSNSETASKRQLELELCVILFKVLHNVQVLNLQVETLELLIQACDSVKHQSSPFKRMKSLNLKYCEGSLDIPDEVVRYFLGGFPNEEDKRFTVEKLC